MARHLALPALYLMAPLSDLSTSWHLFRMVSFSLFPPHPSPQFLGPVSFIRKRPPDFSFTQHRSAGKIDVNRILLKTSGADVLSSRKKLKKCSEGSEEATPPHPYLYIRRLKQNAFVSLRPDEEICLIYAHQDKTGNKYDGVLKQPANVSNKNKIMPAVFQLVKHFYR